MTEHASTCGCGCSTVPVITNAAEPCGCGCECCEPPPKTKEEEVAELHRLRAAVDRRLTELEGS